jgi:small GTP-binding protein
MLRQVFFYQFQEEIHHIFFGSALQSDEIKPFLNKIWREELISASDRTVGVKPFFRYNVHYLYDPRLKLTIVFVTNLKEDLEYIKPHLEAVFKQFHSDFGKFLDQGVNCHDPHSIGCVDFEIFNPIIEKIHRKINTKLAIVGYSGVGKTTITRLLMKQAIPTQHIPTISGDIGTIQLGKLTCSIWDFAGQEQFANLWTKFIQASDGVLIITDSTKENCEKSKMFIELAKKISPDANIAIIGNKQDLPDAISTIEIEQIMGLKTYNLVAIDENQYIKTVNIIADILDIETSDSSLFKLLVDREHYMKQAEEALQAGDFESLVLFLDKLVDLSIDMGEDDLSTQFYQKSHEIKQALQKYSPAIAPSMVPTINMEIINPPHVISYKFIEQNCREIKLGLKALEEQALKYEIEVKLGKVPESQLERKCELIKTLIAKINAELT